jgi:hypothetical protein
MGSPAHFARLFTVDEANALLATVQPLVQELLDTISRLRSKSETVIRKEDLDPDAPNLMDRLREDSEIARLIGQVKGLVDEIHSYGCICKGVEQGLIDFPCMLGSEVVFLCWKIGEASVGYWHRVEEGFAGRRPLLDVEESDPEDNTPFH